MSTPPQPPLPRAKTPVAIGKVAALAVLWSLLLIALGVVAVRDALVHADLLSGQPWILQALESLDGQLAGDWLVPVGVLALLLAVWLLVVAFKPRPRSEARLQAGTGVFLTKASMRRLAAAAASDVDGVDTAGASATLSRVRVTATTTADQADAVRAGVGEAVTQRLSALVEPPRVDVRVTTTGGQP
ncbi:MAG: DUF6286 domain-containing protein [Actinomycetota bacterium]|nr:DUF6286 domain-containing protein [Actinomycetota bacterium]